MKWIWPARSCLRGVRNTNFDDLIDECHEIVMQLQGFFSVRARSKENLLLHGVWWPVLNGGPNSFPGWGDWGRRRLVSAELAYV